MTPLERSTTLRRRLLSTVLALSTLLFVATFGGAVASADTFPLLAFGDSLTKGAQDTGISCNGIKSGGYPPRLQILLAQRKWDTEIASSGICGETTPEGLSRIGGVLAEELPILVFILEGTNDINSEISIESSLFNLRTMTEIAADAGVQPLLATPPPIGTSVVGLNSGPLASRVRSMAANRGIPFVDLFGELSNIPDLFQTLYQDPFHPNPDGYQVVAELFLQRTINTLRSIDALPIGNGNFCRDFGPCQHGEGDCDGDEECAEDHVCQDNVGVEFGLSENTDICVSQAILDCPLVNGNPRRCTDCGPCSEGQGDCDNDGECLLGLICGEDLGPMFGFGATVDICVQAATPTTCTDPLGSGSFCTFCGPCGEGEGDCDSDAECAAGLVCTDNVGEMFGFSPNVDVCLSNGEPPPPPPACPLANGDSRFCTECGPCQDSQGDCDGDAECAAGTTCVNNVGAMFGFSAATDVCLTSTEPPPPTECTLPLGNGRYCTECGPCQSGQGDCDNDGECAPGLTCTENRGEEFGFAPAVDVCLPPQ